MRNYLIGLTAAAAVGASHIAGADESRERVPDLDHVFVIVLENHNAFTSFGANGILDNPKAPHIQALAKKTILRPTTTVPGTRACRITSR